MEGGAAVVSCLCASAIQQQSAIRQHLQHLLPVRLPQTVKATVGTDAQLPGAES